MTRSGTARIVRSESSDGRTPHPSGSGEDALFQALRTQSNVFGAAVQLIDQIHNHVDLRDPKSGARIIQLQQSLENITASQVRVAKARDELRVSTPLLSDALRAELRRQEGELRTLLQKIDGIRGDFETARDGLIPELDGESRRRSMHTAYQQSLRTV